MLSRRAALKGGTATVAAIAAGGAVGAHPAVDESVIALVEEIGRVRTAWDEADDAQETDANRTRYWELQSKICETPAKSIEGVLTKMRGFYEPDEEVVMAGGGHPIDDLAAEYAASIYRDLLRLVGRARS